MQKNFFSRWLFFLIHFIRFEMHMDGRINLKILLGYHINFLSIWPFMHHPWFPTRKSSKLTFVCFQLQLLNTLQGLKSKSFIWYPKSIFRFIRPSMCISKRIKWILKKSHREKKFFCIFFQSPHQVDLKTIVECPREFIAYFNALETTCDLTMC